MTHAGSKPISAAISRCWRRALVAALSGFAFSMLLSAVVMLGLVFHLAPFTTLERHGVDLGMRMFVRLSAALDRAGAPGGYVFVDVDRAACVTFSRSPRACDHERVVPAALVLAFAKSADDTGAHVVVIDAALDSKAGDRQALADLLDRSDRGAGRRARPWFIIPADARPDGSGVLSTGPVGHTDASPARLVSASFVGLTDPDANDGLVRSYPLVMTIGGAAGERLPSAPLLMAALSRAGNAAAGPCSLKDEACYRKLVDAELDRLGFDGTHPAPPRVFFSLPSLTYVRGAPDAGCLRPTPLQYLQRYERVCASRLIARSAATFDLNPSLFAGKIVVLGSSRLQGRDVHATPIGVMSGAELLINATRSLVEFSPLRESSGMAPLDRRVLGHAEDLGRKIFEAARGSILMFFVWAAIFAVVGIDRLPPPLGAAIAFCLFVLGMGALLWIELAANVEALRRDPRAGRAVDVLTPIVALGLDGYVEGAKAISSRLNRFFDDGVGKAGAAWGVLKSKFMNRSGS